MEYWQCELAPQNFVYVLRERYGEFVTAYFMQGKNDTQKQIYLQQCIADNWVKLEP